jgi:hypothetical protein
MKAKLIITKPQFKLTLNKKEFTLSEQEAQELFLTLNAHFNEEPITNEHLLKEMKKLEKEYVPYPVYPIPPYRMYPFFEVHQEYPRIPFNTPVNDFTYYSSTTETKELPQ